GNTLFRSVFGLKNGRNYRSLGAKSDHLRRSFATKQQGQRVDEHRLARAGFACQEIQPSAKLNRNILDHGEVFKAQFAKHGCPEMREVERRIARKRVVSG